MTLSPGFSVTGSSTPWSCTAYSGANPPSQNHNYVRTERLLIGTANESDLPGLPVESKSTVYQYIDGKGRDIQDVIVQGSPLKSDIVNSTVFDSYGNQTTDPLAYSINSIYPGSFRSNSAAEQGVFYSSTAKVVADAEPYSINSFDNSPVNELIQNYGPGQSWHAGNKSISSYGNNRMVLMMYSVGLRWHKFSQHT